MKKGQKLVWVICRRVLAGFLALALVLLTAATVVAIPLANNHANMVSMAMGQTTFDYCDIREDFAAGSDLWLCTGKHMWQLTDEEMTATVMTNAREAMQRKRQKQNNKYGGTWNEQYNCKSNHPDVEKIF